MLKLLADQLNDPQPEKCIEALLALAMVRETQALDRLTQMWNTEQRPDVKKILGWVGRQLYLANQEGYSTTQAMIQAFRLHVNVSEQADREEEERRKVEKLRSVLPSSSSAGDSPVIKGAIKGLISTGSLGLGGLGGVLYGAGMGYKKALNAHNEDMLNNLIIEQNLMEHVEVNERPITPPRPTDTNIQVWLKKLSSPDAKVRTSAITQLGDFNNPTALGAIGSIYVKDSEESVKAVALQVGTRLYFNALYWQNPPQQVQQ